MEKQQFIVEQDSINLRIDVFLARNFKDCSRTRLKDLINSGHVKVNNKLVKPHYSLKVNDEINVEIPPAKTSKLCAEDIPLEIVFEDEEVIVVNKPDNMVVHPAAGNINGTLVNALLNHTNKLSDVNPERPGIVHRLDKETSGIMVIAKTNFAHLELAKQFKIHSIKRRYIALVKGKVEFKEGVVDLPISRHPFQRKKMAISFEPNTKSAKTNYRTIKRFSDFSLIELFPHTGRTHQLRVHMAYLKHPILGDSKYGDKNSFKRLALHAKDIGFNHPRTNEFLEFSSLLPQEMQKVIGDVKV